MARAFPSCFTKFHTSCMRVVKQEDSHKALCLPGAIVACLRLIRVSAAGELFLKGYVCHLGYGPKVYPSDRVGL